MNKKRNFAKMALLSALFCGLASPTFIGCKDYDDDIKDLQEQITANKTSIDELLGKIKEGQFVQNVEKITNGLKVTLGDGSVVEIVNGKDGVDGNDGKVPSFEIKEDGHLYATYEGQDPVDLGNVRGENGSTGTVTDVKLTVQDGYLYLNGKIIEPKIAIGGIFYVEQQGYVELYMPKGTVNEDGTITVGDYEKVTLPKTTNIVTDILFMPLTLSAGEAPMIFFPTIVQDETDGVGNYANGAATAPEYTVGTIPAEPASILYAGKAELKYQFNPRSVSFEAFKVLGLWRHGEATVISRSMKDGSNMIFNKGQRFYDVANGVLDGAKSYSQDKEVGMLHFRAKSWRFAEMVGNNHQGNKRDLLTLAVLNGKDTVYSEIAPAKHWHIAQKDVRIVNTDVEHYALDANKENLYADKFRSVNSYQDKKVAPVNQEAADEYYKSLAPITTFEIAYDNRQDNGGKGLNLTELFRTFFIDNGEEYPFMENGFDDYQLKFETVSFNNLGVDQTERYLELVSTMEKAGTDERQLVTKAYVKSPDQYPGFEQGDHSAAIGRTPIVRVKLVAPVEDGASAEAEENVVASRLIKLEIKGKESVTEKIVIKDTIQVMLQHKDQKVELDMDHIYNDRRVQQAGSRGREEFHKHYQFDPTIAVELQKQHTAALDADARKQDVDLEERKANDGTILNQLDLIVKPTAFSTEHVEYVVKAKYVDIPNSGEVYPDVHVEYTVFVTYPNAVAPEITKLNWQNPGTNGEGGLIYAHGRIAPGADGKVETMDDGYDMVAVLNNMFDLEKYTMEQMLKPRAGEDAYDLATIAKPTLSFELVDNYNSASDWGGTTEGLKLYQEDGIWKIELEKSDAGREWINAIGEDSKRVKIRAVVSFNECYDGLYGTCNNGDKKYNKDQASDNLPECKTTDKVGAQAHDMHDYTGTAKAPEYGRSQVVIKEFEVAFITPIRFVKKTIDPLYDKYPLAENKAYLKDCFRLADYLSDENAAQEGFRYNHIVYDTDLTDQGTIDLFKRGTDGWCNYWKQVYDVNAQFEYKVIGGFFNDGSTLDTENSKKIKFEKDAEGEYITWINDGEDIANEFVIKVEVCVKHVWGLVCNHANKETERGHSIVTLEIPVKFHKN